MINLNQIYAGDCLPILKSLPDGCVDLVFTDPPYNENFNYRGSNFIDHREDYYVFLESVLVECRRVLKDSGSIYLKHSSRQIHLILPIVCRVFNFQNLIIWISNSQAHPDKNYDSYYEPLYFATKTQDYVFNKRAELRAKPPNFWSGEGKEFIGLLTNCWYDIKKIQAGCLRSIKEGAADGYREKPHPCSMPTRLAERAIKVSSPEGGVVLDPFVGSGSTCIAAKLTDRQYIGIETQAEYIELANRRIENTAVNETLF